MKGTVPHILTLLVNNEFGVLTRITSQIRREGWNIKTLAVAESTDPTISRITLALECFDTTLPTVVQRLARLACVQSVTAYDEQKHICRELAIAVVQLSTENLSAILKEFNASILQQEEGVTVIEVVGSPAQLTEFSSKLNTMNEKSIARTGPIALEKQYGMERMEGNG